jgi:hypothetical protein
VVEVEVVLGLVEDLANSQFALLTH